MTSLMVMVPDKISDFVTKGEVTERYYNPGNLFDDVHLVMTNDDRPDPSLVQKMVGRARLHLHNLPDSRDVFLPTLGWRPSLLGSWTNHALALAHTIQPALIRCHGALLNAYAAAVIKRKLGVPYVVSLHINPDEDVRGRTRSIARWVVARLQQDVERIGLCSADMVLPVYQPIIPYLRRLGISQFEVCYNVLNPSSLRRKNDYRLHDPVSIICVGRQFKEKNPENLIKAVGQMSGVRLTLVGDGPYHEHLKLTSDACNLSGRVEFVRSMSNDDLCRILPEFDVFATHTEYWEISKSVLEPLLTGLPVIINRRIGAPVPELADNICMLVTNSVEAYQQGLSRLISDHAFRERLGREAYAYAQANWSPLVTEAKFVEIYSRLLKTRGSPMVEGASC